MQQRNTFPRLLALGLAALSVTCGDRATGPTSAVPERIVTMAPSLTETVVALGLGDRLVGVTRYCPPVPGAATVGGYFDPSYETIVSLDPDLVIVMQSHEELRRRLGDLGLATLQVDQHDVEGILAAIEVIATRCGVDRRGRELAARLREQLQQVSAAVAGRHRPRALVVVGREPGAGLGTLWVAAEDTFYDDVLRLAGGVNAVEGTAIRYPELSREGLLAIDPEVILDVLADGGSRGVTADRAVADWSELGELGAVRDGRVHVLMEDFVVIPGPRIVDTVRTVAEHLHPELTWP